MLFQDNSDSGIKEECPKLSIMDLLSMARQIATGMVGIKHPARGACLYMGEASQLVPPDLPVPPALPAPCFIFEIAPILYGTLFSYLAHIYNSPG